MTSTSNATEEKRVNVDSDKNITEDNGRWTTDILKTIKEYGDETIQASARVAQVELTSNVKENENEFVCDGHYHPVTKQSSIRLPTVRETFEDDVEEDKARYTLASIQRKISTASCHKRRRGYVRKFHQNDYLIHRQLVIR